MGMRDIKNKNISLSTQIFIAMILGTLTGLLVGKPIMQITFIGDIWLNCIKMIVVPMVVCTIISGIISQNSSQSLKRISTRIILYYVFTTILACMVGLLVAHVAQPGYFANFAGMDSQEIPVSGNITLAGFFKGLFSTNMVKTFADGNIIQTLIIAIFLGIAILRMKSTEHKQTIIQFFNSANDMIFSLIRMIMAASPIGVFFLMAACFGKYGASVFTGIAALLGTYYLACFVHIVFIYGMFLFLFVKINPFKFLKDSSELWIYTLSTCSSIASIPVNIKVAREKYNVPDRISGFTIPLGSQMNSDGSVLLYACIITFISQMIGQTMTLAQLMNIIFVSTVMSMGGGGVPGSGIVKLMVVVQAVGLPIEVVGIIAAFYHLFDMGTTTNNCLGDLVGTVVVSKAEETYALKQSNSL